MIINEEMARQLLQKRPTKVHKGVCGRVLVVAGSTGLTGAAALSSQAAMRAGAGIVSLACPQSLNTIFEIKLTEVMTIPVLEAEPGKMGIAALEDLLEKEKNFDITLLGPGLGRHEETMALVREFIIRAKSRLILDADALYAIRGKGEILKKCREVPVLTPHLGEMAALLGISVDELRQNILGITRQAAEEYNAVFVVKSEKTVVVFPKGDDYITGVGNAGMATAGSGDVLAGTIAGIYKQTVSDKNDMMAAPLGVYIHGRAGDLACEDFGVGLIATDIINNIGNVLLELSQV